jgi:taurine dioxygenase
MRRVPDGWAPRNSVRLELQPCTEVIGAEVWGVDLADPLDDETLADIRHALNEWKVLFFRNQALSADQQVAFALRFGELEQHPFLRQGEKPEVVRFEKGENRKDPYGVGSENGWHSDTSWRAEPAFGSVLRAVEVPEWGGDTLWADMGCAYDNLPGSVRERVDGLQAVHSFGSSFGQMLSADERAAMEERFPAVVHPVVRTHPETGRKTLYVNAYFTDRIVGLEPDESEALLDRLCQQAMHPEWQVRLRWEPGTVAFWDNRATQHYASSDYYPRRRVMDRVAIKGDRPF